MSERALPPLDLSGSSSQVAQKSQKWKQAFEYYAEGKGLDNTQKKTSQLLLYAGNPDPANENQDPYTMCQRKLDHHFCAEENIPFKQHMLRQMVPNEGERVYEYLVHLRQQPRHCNFGVGGIR